ncbi:MAG: lipocalin family protein [Bacteroidota bacterium]
MKKNLLFSTVAFCALLFIVSCGDDGDEPAAAHEVGTWELDSYALQDFPVGFESNEGLVLAIEQITFGGVQIQSYELVLNSDGTYEREINIAGPDLDDEGTWTLDDDDLELESEDGNDQDFNVEKNEDDDLWLSERNGITAAFIPDIYFDTVSQTYLDFLDTLTDAQRDSIATSLEEVIELDLLYVFERD